MMAETFEQWWAKTPVTNAHLEEDVARDIWNAGNTAGNTTGQESMRGRAANKVIMWFAVAPETAKQSACRCANAISRLRIE